MLNSNNYRQWRVCAHEYIPSIAQQQRATAEPPLHDTCSLSLFLCKGPACPSCGKAIEVSPQNKDNICVQAQLCTTNASAGHQEDHCCASCHCPHCWQALVTSPGTKKGSSPKKKPKGRSNLFLVLERRAPRRFYFGNWSLVLCFCLMQQLRASQRRRVDLINVRAA